MISKAKRSLGFVWQLISGLPMIAFMAVLFNGHALAASSEIMSDREDECAIYLCLPSGFGVGCEAAHKAFIKRTTSFTSENARKYTDLPAFNLCVDYLPQEITSKLSDLNLPSEYRDSQK